jgi:release factor glutamine methyltransferase
MTGAWRPGTIREAWVQASSLLKERKSGQDPDRVVLLLMQHLFGWSRTDIVLHWDDPFPADRLDAWRQALARKVAGEPVQYITGEQAFYGVSFTVTPDVLIPRPETELLVERLAELGGELWPAEADVAAADIGTGSGAIAVTLARLKPSWRITATDVSEAALRVARANASRHGVAGRLRFVCGDLLTPLIADGAAVDVLVSNPPYIPTAKLAGLQREVRDHEPRLALDGGADGLDVCRRILEQLPLLKAPPRVVGFELGAGQPEIVAPWLRAIDAGYETEIVRDLAGIGRHLIAVRRV